ncbi:serine/threonine protein kinase [Capsulimonas corticalis]|uniref:Serine/threonine protein kinase n=1 Tax=Capsulimonas corticalis TaxID=2219043 RepID=A0A402CSR2_9BACT|nr:serine/threonine protein kinase [Capsulimonas corticalis]
MFSWRDIAKIDETPERLLNRIGRVFATFDENTQDSGNISYGVQIGEDRYFVKTAGRPDYAKCFFPHEARVALLWNAKLLWEECPDLALAQLEHAVSESPHGPLLIYEWMEGESLGTSREQREDPASAFQRFRTLPAGEIALALDTLFEVHERLAQKEWVAVDFYDGALMYDFDRRRLRLVDIDMYHKGAFTNKMGEMFGSSRFMAPEEHVQGAAIDQSTTVFTLGRAAAVFLGDGTLERSAWRGSEATQAVILRACAERPADRYPTVAAFSQDWSEARMLETKK